MKRAIIAFTALCLLALGFRALAAADAGETTLPGPEQLIDMTEAPADDPASEDAPGETFTLWFEEGFGLSVPRGWVSYTVSDADRAAGTRYILGDGTGEGWVYIQAQPTMLGDARQLSEMIETEMKLEKTGDLVFGATPFVAFLDRAQNASGCATLWQGELLAFVFSPQSNSEFIMAATEVMESFTISK